MNMSFCTTCMDRKEHLMQTLPTNLTVCDWAGAELIVLDYGSTDGLSSWLLKEFEAYAGRAILRIYRTEEPRKYNSSHAKNVVHLLAHGDVLTNLDADNFISCDYIEQVQMLMGNTMRNVVYAPENAGGCYGRISLWRQNFLDLGGYDESLVDYGFDDGDILDRALKFGCTLRPFDREHLNVIWHGDDLRMRRYESKEQLSSWQLNRGRSAQNIQDGKLCANPGKTWGKAAVIDIFTGEPKYVSFNSSEAGRRIHANGGSAGTRLPHHS